MGVYRSLRWSPATRRWQERRYHSQWREVYADRIEPAPDAGEPAPVVRRCAHEGCATILSRYNAGDRCGVHEGQPRDALAAVEWIERRRRGGDNFVGWTGRPAGWRAKAG